MLPESERLLSVESEVRYTWSSQSVFAVPSSAFCASVPCALMTERNSSALNMSTICARVCTVLVEENCTFSLESDPFFVVMSITPFDAREP